MPREVVAQAVGPASSGLLRAAPEAAHVRLHASCVQLGSVGVVLLGPSGVGKSDLALRLIDAGALLVADDQLQVEATPAGLLGRPAETLAGLLEVRGLGILRLPYCRVSPLGLVVDLDAARPAPRLPEPSTYPILGIELRRLLLDPRQASAAAKVRLALCAEQVV
jgi:serine kinase of HPr protein (carbohydrate metabolism regulator)